MTICDTVWIWSFGVQLPTFILSIFCWQLAKTGAENGGAAAPRPEQADVPVPRQVDCLLFC